MPTDDSAIAFWNFLQAQAKELSSKRFDASWEAAFDRARELLAIYNDQLGLEVVKSDESARTALLITAYSDASQKDSVLKLMESKPAPMDIDVIAFRPATSEKFEIEIAGINVSVDDMRFSPLESELEQGTVGVDVHFRDELLLPPDVADTIAILAVSSILGEEVVMDELAVIRARPEGLKPFSELEPMETLPRFIERNRKKRLRLH